MCILAKTQTQTSDGISSRTHQLPDPYSAVLFVSSYFLIESAVDQSNITIRVATSI